LIEKTDVIFHLASNTDVRYWHCHAEEQYLENVCGMKVLLQNLRKPCRLVLASSIHVPYMQSLYAASKAACESLLQAYINMGLIDGVILRLTSVVGKGMTHGVVKDFMEKLRSDSPTLDIIGEAPGSTRPYIHVSDAVSAFVYYGIEKDEAKGKFHYIVDHKSVTIDEIADIVMQEMGIHKPKLWLGKASKWLGDVDVMRRCRCDDIREKWRPHYSCRGSIIQAVRDNL
jgi:UDP-glucose 4-epimerase